MNTGTGTGAERREDGQGGEPAGAMRIRYFGDFAMPVRLAVLAKFRAPAFAGNVALKLARHTFRFLGRKGFTRFYGRSLREVLPFWTLFGAEPLENGVFRIGGYECVAIAGVRARPADALTLHSGHLLLMRPEGQWDRPGVHDRAAGVDADVPADAASREHERIRASLGVLDAAGLTAGGRPAGDGGAFAEAVTSVSGFGVSKCSQV